MGKNKYLTHVLLHPNQPGSALTLSSLSVSWKANKITLLSYFLMQDGESTQKFCFVLLTVRVFQQLIARWFHREILQNFGDGEHCQIKFHASTQL